MFTEPIVERVHVVSVRLKPVPETTTNVPPTPGYPGNPDDGVSVKTRAVSMKVADALSWLAEPTTSTVYTPCGLLLTAKRPATEPLFASVHALAAEALFIKAAGNDWNLKQDNGPNPPMKPAPVTVTVVPFAPEVGLSWILGKI